MAAKRLFFRFFISILCSIVPIYPIFANSSNQFKFDDIDKNKDGSISKEEYELFQDSQPSLQEESSTDSSESVSEESSTDSSLIESVSEESSTDSSLIESVSEESKSLTDFISLKGSYFDATNFLGANCAQFKECDSSKPARFSYTLSEGEDIFNVDAALILKAISIDDNIGDSDKRWIAGLSTQPVIEAHVSSSDSANRNSVSAAMPFILSFVDGIGLCGTSVEPEFCKDPDIKPSLFSAHTLLGVPKFDTDRDLDTKVLGFELLYTPTSKSLGIGTALFDDDLAFRWRPLIGFELGQVIDNGNNIANLPSDSFARVVAKLRAELGIVKRLVLSADYSVRQDLTGNQDFNDYFNVSATYFLDKNKFTSVGVSYEVGANTPTFNDVNKFNAFFGLQF